MPRQTPEEPPNFAPNKHHIGSGSNREQNARRHQPPLNNGKVYIWHSRLVWVLRKWHVACNHSAHFSRIRTSQSIFSQVKASIFGFVTWWWALFTFIILLRRCWRTSLHDANALKSFSSRLPVVRPTVVACVVTVVGRCETLLFCSVVTLSATTIPN